MLVLVILAVSTSLMLATFAIAPLNLRSADNLQKATDARMAAESGMAFTLHALKSLQLPHDTTEATFVANMTAALAGKLDGTDNLAGQMISGTETAVFLPEISLGDQRSFCAWLTWVGEKRCQLKVRGSAGNLFTDLVIELALVSKLPKVFEYGIASRGPLLVTGPAQVLGVNEPGEGSLFCASDSVPDPVHIDGSNVTISGDIYVADESASVVVGGTPSIGGTSDPEGITDHIHFGADSPDFPELDTAPLAALATTVVDSSTDTSGGVFNNIRIVAGTNPTFDSDVVVNGVVYVEAPNIVKFAGKATVNGIIVTQDNGSPIESCQLIFGGNATGAGVDVLPDTPEFQEVKQHTGTFLLAPGFDVSFGGGFDTINGSIAADQLSFGGSTTGLIKGSIISLADRPTEIGGSVTIQIDHSDLDQDPAGFVKPLVPDPLPGSYEELIGQ